MATWQPALQPPSQAPSFDIYIDLGAGVKKTANTVRNLRTGKLWKQAVPEKNRIQIATNFTYLWKND